MEALSRFDIAVHGDAAMVVVESDLLPPDPAIVVIPLLRDYPAVPQLNPHIRCAGGPLVLATRLIGAVRRNGLRRIGSAAQQGDEITRAIDVLMSGV
ncbi:CcdB family protein [Sulfitobacter aestuarii]|uniref:Toxin CcdB n=1 Tax=Sulfitobacter aestuarii TaxID=2161676 RepID=A0ABW5U431_9RHOB